MHRKMIVGLIVLLCLLFTTPLRATLALVQNPNVGNFSGGTWTTYTYANDNDVTALAIEGNYLWTGTSSDPYAGRSGSGVVRWDITTGDYVKYTTADGLASNSIQSIAIDSAGNKWFGTSDGVSKFDGDTWTSYTTANSGLADNYVNSIVIDSAGNKWFGTDGGVSKFDDVIWTTYTPTDGLASNHIHAIAIDSADNKWFCTSGYVSKFDGTTWVTYSSGGAPYSALAIAIDSAGNKWFGEYYGGASKFDGTIWTNYTTTDGLVDNDVLAIAIDSAGNKWFGTNGGVSKFDGAT